MKYLLVGLSDHEAASVLLLNIASGLGEDGPVVSLAVHDNPRRIAETALEWADDAEPNVNDTKEQG